MIATLVLLVACSLWIAGLHGSRDRGVDRWALEYWWALSAFFFGGVGALATFSFLTLTFEQAMALRTAPLILMGLAMVVQTLLSRQALIPPTGFALLFYFGILFTGDGFVMPFACLLAYLPVLIVPATGYNLNSLRAGATTGISLFLVVILGLGLAQPGALLGACRTDKCSRWGVALGALTTGNALGMYLAAAAAISLVSAPKWYSFLLTLIGSFILTELTSSRSGLYAWYILVASAVAYILSQRLQSRLPLVLAALVVSATAVAIPLMNWSPRELTFRPVLWWNAIDLIKDSPILGYGASFWVRNEYSFPTGTGFAISANYSTHNIVTELLITGGAMGTFAFVLALVLASRSGRGFATSTYTIFLTCVIVGASLTEVSAIPGRLYLFDGLGIYLFMAASSVGGSGRLTSGRSDYTTASETSTPPLPRSATKIHLRSPATRE
jgi:O-antigen ligase